MEKCEFLISNLNTINWSEVYTLASKIGFAKLKEKAFNKLCKEFLPVEQSFVRENTATET